ncbi:copper chaperone PCu(A)C [Undibacterium fentianense]|uniref:Copper chaperone PCu(A)C n=1 Tax=Undibacterium fentianense TaxID=2828728 RepID=A0A941IGH8_9BURK|nr:copper chaperone PCu(A)C [Undibacterium fentianense]MBR7801392.1 copper chaperone PCu(A)C [Undibacterium fentianense]
MKKIIAPLFAALSLSLSAAAFSQVAVKDPWVRATVAQQKATGAFMQLTSTQDTKIISASSPAAKSVEIHTMEMDKDVMKMRQIMTLDLPAGKAVELKPGSFHVMLIGLTAQVKEGDIVPLTLTIEGKDKKTQTIEVKAVGKAMNTTAHKMQH